MMQTLASITATCTETGLTEGSHCSVCGTVIVAQETVPASGHTTEVVNAKAPTCTEAGYSGDEVCTVCGETVHVGAVMDALGHDTELQNASPATRTEAGYTGDEVCTVCGEVITEGTAIDALGHDWGEWAETTPATYKAPGEGSRSCARCGETETREIPQLVPVSDFSDVVETEYYAVPVAWAVDQGITAGTSASTFSPNDSCTRAQIVSFLYRYLG